MTQTLSDAEETYLIDNFERSSKPLNDDLVDTLGINEVAFLISRIDRQDTNSSYTYAVYASKLDKRMAKLKSESQV